MAGADFASGVDPGSTASSLVEGVKTLQPSAWRQFTTVYGPLIYSWARRAGLQGDDAADITQEVFRSVAVGAPTLQYRRPGDTFRGWLWTITRNKLHDFWRVRSGKPQAAGGTDAQELMLLVPESVSESGAEPANGSGGVLRRAMELVRAEFEQRSWDAFWRVTVEGRPAADVAGELGMSVNAIYVSRSRILRHLREILASEEFGTAAN